MRTVALFVVSVIALTAGYHAAHAAPPVITNRLWSSQANGCVPDDNSRLLYDSRGAGVGFLSASTGTIRMFCPIAISTTGAAPSITGLAVSYKLFTGTTGSVAATLWRIPDGSNAAVSLCTATASASAGGLDVTFCTATGAFSKTNAYFVEVVITRSNTTVDPEALSVFVYN